MLPYNEDGYNLLLSASAALARVEANGIHIDTKYIKTELARLFLKIKEGRKALREHKVMRRWRKVYKSRTNIESTEQLGKVLFEVMGFDSPGRTKGGRHKTDEASLAKLDHPFVVDYMQIKKDIKATQFLKGIQRETCDHYLHPNFNLHVVLSFRSSSSNPNFQNLPVRNAEMSQAVRRAFIARKGRCLVEWDYGGIEVKTAACYNKDPRMIQYIKQDYDYHKEMAMECFQISKAVWEKMVAEDAKNGTKHAKNARYVAKNKLVFPLFYGSYWLDCARHLWEDMLRMGLQVCGVPMRKWLQKKGISRLGDQDKEGNKPTPGTYEAHIAAVQERFWGERFMVYDQWRKDIVQQYRRDGFMTSYTGFVYQGPLRRNQIINLQPQGSAAHCLLWALVQLIDELRKRRMKALVIGQIHDSVVADVPVEEVDDYLQLSKDIAIRRVMKHWPWIIVPLEIEAEVSPVNGSWVEKKERDLE